MKLNKYFDIFFIHFQKFPKKLIRNFKVRDIDFYFHLTIFIEQKEVVHCYDSNQDVIQTAG